MKKLMMLAAMLAMVMVTAVPALAQTSLQIETEEVESGGVDQGTTVSGTGLNSNQCAQLLNAAQTGNVQNAQALLQYASEADDLEINTGGQLTLSPELAAECNQKVEQAATAGKGGEAKAGGAQAKAEEAKAGGAQAKAAPPAPAPKAQLPASGGISLVVLGAGVLLVAGGLIARRLTR